MKEINIWELGNKINVRISPDFLRKINLEIKNKFGSKPKFYNELIKSHNMPFDSFKNVLKYSNKFFIDLSLLISICKLLGLSLEELQNNVIAYKTAKGVNYIDNLILPIKITPIFDMLVAHHIGDGCLMNCSDNRKDYFLYRQYDKFYRDLYIQKIESLFGKIHYKSDYIDKNTTTQVYAPVVVSELMCSYYGLNRRSFISETARIPEQIFDKDWKSKLAFLIALIIDEGHVDSCLVVIRLKNVELIEDLSRLCKDLDYKNSVKIERGGYACLYILSTSLSKFYKDYLVLKSEYPEVDLGFKGDKLKEFIDRINKPKVYRPGNKDIIFNLLSKEHLTVNELATRLKMTRQGARYLIHKLEKENKVEVKSIVKFANWKYGVKNADWDCGKK